MHPLGKQTSSATGMPIKSVAKPSVSLHQCGTKSNFITLYGLWRLTPESPEGNATSTILIFNLVALIFCSKSLLKCVFRGKSESLLLMGFAAPFAVFEVPSLPPSFASVLVPAQTPLQKSFLIYSFEDFIDSIF